MFIKKLWIVFVAGVFLLMTLPSASARPQVKTYLVNADTDVADANPGDGICDIGAWLSYCTLHAAIQEANLDGVDSIINFTMPMKINYPSLPPVEGSTVIDASNQWDGTWPGGRPGVSINGAGYSNGLLNLRYNYNIVRGIEFSGSGSVGVYIGHSPSGNSSFNVVGGSGVGQRNVFLVGDTGVTIETAAGISNIISDNYFGTWDGENAVPGYTGIGIYDGNGNFVKRNLIGGHTYTGISIWTAYNAVQNNIIGTNKVKNTAMPNGLGISIVQRQPGYNLVQNNFIAGNSSHGVELLDTSYNTVVGNIIGDSWTVGNGGDGIHVQRAYHNVLGKDTAGNQISNNGGYGVWLDGNDNAIQNNGINGNTLDGVYIKNGKNNRIGGKESLRNEIGNNSGSGVRLAGTGTVSNTVSGNYIGLESGAFDAGNQGHGVLVEAGANTNRIGGLGAGEGNWVGWNSGSGIYITGAATQGNVVEGNVVGAPVGWGWKAPNGHHGIAIYDGAHQNWIGIGNTVLSSNWSGIAIVGSDENIVWFNAIGTNGAGINWGNSYYGIVQVNSAGNVIFTNEIAYNGTNAGEAGVRVDGGLAGNPININSIHDNAGLGIELINGGNAGLGAPTLSTASCQGPVAGTACAGCTIEIFSDASDEGHIYEASVTADATTGAFSWSGTPSGPNVTATATDGASNTSPFSVPVNTGICNNIPTAVFNISPASGSPITNFSFDASTSSDIEDPVSALEIHWDWEDDGTYDTNWSTTKTALHSFSTVTIHTVRLQVRDTTGLMDATTQQVSVGSTQHLYLPVIIR